MIKRWEEPAILHPHPHHPFCMITPSCILRAPRVGGGCWLWWAVSNLGSACCYLKALQITPLGCVAGWQSTHEDWAKGGVVDFSLRNVHRTQIKILIFDWLLSTELTATNTETFNLLIGPQQQGLLTATTAMVTQGSRVCSSDHQSACKYWYL